jgi:hypothetical protein
VIRPDQIPDEVVEVVAEEFFAADIFTNDLPDPRWQDVSELTRRIYRDFTRRTLLTAINAWPDAEMDRECLCYFGDNIILPLPHEEGDA